MLPRSTEIQPYVASIRPPQIKTQPPQHLAISQLHKIAPSTFIKYCKSEVSNPISSGHICRKPPSVSKIQFGCPMMSHDKYQEKPRNVGAKPQGCLDTPHGCLAMAHDKPHGCHDTPQGCHDTSRPMTSPRGAMTRPKGALTSPMTRPKGALTRPTTIPMGALTRPMTSTMGALTRSMTSPWVP